MNDTYLHLQNGSDIRGVAVSGPGEPVTLTGEAANAIAAAFGVWLAAKLGKQPRELRIGVGHDSRLTAGALKGEILSGLTARGVTALDCGLASTPSMFMGTVFPETGFDGSIMITASHLPSNRNGMKFFTREGGLDKQDIRALLETAGDLGAQSGNASGEPAGLMRLYAAFLRKKIVDGAACGEKPLSGLHIVIDAGNGAGGFFVRDVLEPLGADCTGSQFLEPDGRFPNHQPNPENKEAMESICGAVCRSGADLGIIFDTDVDRMSAVFADGREVNRDSIIALMAAILAPEYPGSTIVTDSVTSDRLTGFLENGLGLVHHRYMRGYKNVINEAVRLNRTGVLAPLAIETSGHGAMKENYFLDDGAYLAVRLIVAAAKAKRDGQQLQSLINGFTPAEYRCEYRLKIAGDDFKSYGKMVLDAFAEGAQAKGLELVTPSYEGIRLSFPGKGWALLRMSLHDPLMPLNAESGTAEGLTEILAACKELLDGFDRLDRLKP